VTSHGHGALSLGLSAYDALYDLCDVSPWSEERRGYWVPSDKRSFQGWFNIEDRTTPALADPTITEDQVEHLTEMLFTYNVTLPYDEAERHWLFDAYDGAWGVGSIGIIRRQETRIVSGGLRRVVYGRELMQRWWSWRRDTDQFAGQGTVDLARDALCTLIEMTNPGVGLPQTYVALRGIDRTGQPDSMA
jgi:hypothetical protein